MGSAHSQEEEVLTAVLQYVEASRGIRYFVKTRPEKDVMEPGTYDFLCVSDSDEQPEMAIEITTFMESRYRKSFDKSISGVAHDLVNRLEGKLPGTFELQIAGPTRRARIVPEGPMGWRLEEEPVRYRDLERKRAEIVDELKREILEVVRDGGMIPEEQQMIFQPIECDLIKVGNEGCSLTVLMDYFDPEMPPNLGKGNFQKYLSRTVEDILAKKNKQLRIAKIKGKVTALILSIDVDDPLAYSYGTTENLQAVFSNQPEWKWAFIDQVFLERKGNVQILVSK